jgi:hypothetical protein
MRIGSSGLMGAGGKEISLVEGLKADDLLLTAMNSQTLIVSTLHDPSPTTNSPIVLFKLKQEFLDRPLTWKTLLDATRFLLAKFTRVVFDKFSEESKSSMPLLRQFNRAFV